MLTVRVVATCACLAICAVTPRGAQAYCLNVPSALNQPVSWKTNPVTYRVSDNLTDPDILKAIDDAFQTWQAVKCSTLTFTKGAPFKICTETDKTKCPQDTVHVEHGTPYIYIFWFDSSNSAAFPIGDTNAYYNFTWYGMSASIEGATLAVNAFKYDWDAKGGDKMGILDTQNEFTTMVGAVIGLADSSVADASMNPTLTFGDTSKRTLHQDDINGLVYLYKDTNDASCTDPPAPGPSGCSGAPPAGDGSTSSPDAGTPPVGDGGGSGGDSGTTQPGGDSGSSSGDGGVVTGDGGGNGGDPAVPSGDDDGCCRVGHARASNIPVLTLMGLGLLLLIGGRRRR